MELTLKRNKSFGDATISPLLINGNFECHILEDVIREVPGVVVNQWKVPGKTAIPAGRYRVVLSLSNRFKKVLPEILDVPGFAGIRIHGGNKAADTEGCLITGQRATKTQIVGGTSLPALHALQDKIKAAIDGGEKVFIRISNP